MNKKLLQGRLMICRRILAFFTFACGTDVTSQQIFESFRFFSHYFIQNNTHGSFLVLYSIEILSSG